jgi:hypothetical protein
MPARNATRLALLSAALCLGLVGVARAEVVQRGDLRVKVDGKVAPRALPRHGQAPVTVTVGGRITTTDGGTPPQLRRMTIAINSHGHLEPRGLPVCPFAAIQPASSAEALRACRGARVGEGSFSADVAIPTQAPFPSSGKVIAFNGRLDGRPAILAHVYGTKPVPTSFTLPFLVTHSPREFGTTLSASLPQTTGEWGFVTGIRITLGRTFRYHGGERSYLGAGCPAPDGFGGALFPFIRTGFGFAGAGSLTTTLLGNCKATGQ